MLSFTAIDWLALIEENGFSVPPGSLPLKIVPSPGLYNDRTGTAAREGREYSPNLAIGAFPVLPYPCYHKGAGHAMPMNRGLTLPEGNRPVSLFSLAPRKRGRPADVNALKEAACSPKEEGMTIRKESRRYQRPEPEAGRTFGRVMSNSSATTRAPEDSPRRCPSFDAVTTPSVCGPTNLSENK